MTFMDRPSAILLNNTQKCNGPACGRRGSHHCRQSQSCLTCRVRGQGRGKHLLDLHSQMGSRYLGCMDTKPVPIPACFLYGYVFTADVRSCVDEGSSVSLLLPSTAFLSIFLDILKTCCCGSFEAVAGYSVLIQKLGSHVQSRSPGKQTPSNYVNMASDLLL